MPSVQNSRFNCPENHKKCKCATTSPMAKVVWCKSSSLLNITSSRSAAQHAFPWQASSTSAKRSRWWSCSCLIRSCSPVNGLPCDGKVSVSGAQAPNLSEANAFSALTTGNYFDKNAPESSILYLKMTGKRGTPMPVSGVNKDYAALVLAWIKQGAGNN